MVKTGSITFDSDEFIKKMPQLESRFNIWDLKDLLKNKAEFSLLHIINLGPVHLNFFV